MIDPKMLEQIDELIEQLTDRIDEFVPAGDEPVNIALATILREVDKADRKRLGLSREEVEALRFGMINGMGLLDTVSMQDYERSMEVVAEEFVASAYSEYPRYRAAGYDFEAWLNTHED